MSLARISSRYAKSLLDFAIEQDKLERIYQDILQLKIAVSVRDFVLLCKSPIVQPGKKAQVFNLLFKDNFDPITFGFFNILLKKGREAFVPEIVEEFISQYEAIRKITRVTLTTATPLDEKVIRNIKEKLAAATATRENIELETKIKPSLIGGFVLEFDDKLYDASVAHRLLLMRKAFKENDSIKSN